MALSILLSAAASAFQPAPVMPALAPPSRSSNRTIRLTAPQMLALAERTRARGDVAGADKLLAALARDPDPAIRAEARYRQARQLIAEDRKAAAAVLLRQVLDDRPSAAPVRLQLARLMAELGDSDGALRELRSVRAGDLPPEVAMFVDRFSRAIRARRPAGYSLEFAIAPDSNINRATHSDTLGTVIGDFDIGEDSKAKSGTGVALRGQAYRRFQTPVEALSVLARASASTDLYRKSAFNDVAIDLAAGPELQFGGTRIAVEAGATRRWFGQKEVLRAKRLAASLALPLGGRTLARLSGSVSGIDNRVNDLQDATAYAARVDVERALTPSTGIALNAGFDRASARDPAYSTSGWRGGVAGWHMAGRTTLTAGVQIGRLKADERLILFPEKRSDRSWSASFGATLRRFEVAGLAPIVRFTLERNRSTLEFHDYRRRRTEIGLVRAF